MSPRRRIPARGDLYAVTLNPVTGNELQGEQRPVLVISPEAFNAHNPALCVPVTQGGNHARVQGFAVTLLGTGLRTQGAVIASQVRALDLAARHASYLETAPDFVVQEVLARLNAILDDSVPAS